MSGRSGISDMASSTIRSEVWKNEIANIIIENGSGRFHNFGLIDLDTFL